MKHLIIFLLFPVYTVAQWPGYFYAFTLKNSTGNLVTLNNKECFFKPVKPTKGDIMLNVLMCDDSSTLRFYVGGNNGLYESHKLEIINVHDNSKMIIEFPSSISGGEEKYFRNLYLGDISFKKGSYQVKLPTTDSAWGNLKEKKFCPDYGGNDSYWDISSLQRQ